MELLDVLMGTAEHFEKIKKAWNTKSSFRRLIDEGGVKLLICEKGLCEWKKTDYKYEVKKSDVIKIGKLHIIKML